MSQENKAPNIVLENTLLGSLLSIWIGFLLVRINTFVDDKANNLFPLNIGIFYFILIVFLIVNITLLRIATSKEESKERYNDYGVSLFSIIFGVFGIWGFFPKTINDGLVFFIFIIVLFWIISVEYIFYRINRERANVSK